MPGMRRQEKLQAVMFSYHVFESGGEMMLAVCDLELLGKEFIEGDFMLDISKEFYSGSKGSEKDVLPLLKKSTIVNAAGEKIIGVMMKNHIVDKECILRVCGVPHAQVISV